MYNEEINKMIMTSMKSGEKEKAAVYRLLKSEFLKFNTAKDAKTLDDAAEIQIIRKMVKERKESEKVYADAGRNDLAENERNEYLILEALLPAAPKDEEIEAFIVASYPDGIEQKQMGNVIKEVKAKWNAADGKTVSELVRKHIVK